MRKLTLYRDDSTTQVVFDNVKHWFWTAGNTVLTVAQYLNVETGEHHYINWPRERFCWFKDDPMPEMCTTCDKCGDRSRTLEQVDQDLLCASCAEESKAAQGKEG